MKKTIIILTFCILLIAPFVWAIEIRSGSSGQIIQTDDESQVTRIGGQIILEDPSKLQGRKIKELENKVSLLQQRIDLLENENKQKTQRNLEAVVTQLQSEMQMLKQKVILMEQLLQQFYQNYPTEGQSNYTRQQQPEVQYEDYKPQEVSEKTLEEVADESIQKQVDSILPFLMGEQ